MSQYNNESYNKWGEPKDSWVEFQNTDSYSLCKKYYPDCSLCPAVYFDGNYNKHCKHHYRSF